MDSPPPPRRKTKPTSFRKTFGDPCIFALFALSGIVCFLSILIVMASAYIRSNTGGMVSSVTKYQEDAELNHLSYVFAFMGALLSVIASLSCACIFGKMSFKSNRSKSNNAQIKPELSSSKIRMWGDTATSDKDAASSLGGKAHMLVRLLTSIKTDEASKETISRCIHVLRSNPNLWDADRTTIEKAMEKTNEEQHVTSDSQTGVWLRGILSATPDWLENNPSDDDEEALFDENEHPTISSTTNSTPDNPKGNKKDKERRRSSFQGMVHKMVVSKRLVGPFANGAEDQSLIKMMDTIFLFKFDIFKFDIHTGKNSLVFLTLEAVRRLRLPAEIRPHSKSFSAFLTDIQSGYNDNPYHNRLHAADVVQTCGHFLSRPIMKIGLKGLDKLVLLVAAAIHDYAHPGVSNGFLVTTKDPIATGHNDDSPLERFHCAEAFRVMNQTNNTFSRGWSKVDQRRFRHACIQLVLCTDLGLGMGMINQFNLARNEIASNCSTQPNKNDFSMPQPQTDAKNSIRKRVSSFGYPKFEDRLLILKVALRCADISHPSKDKDIHIKWTNCINKEFFAQGRKEKQMNLSVSPLCEEVGFNLAKSQQGFINFLVKPTLTPFAAFADGSEWLEQLEENYQMWKQLEEDNTNSEKENKTSDASDASMV